MKERLQKVLARAGLASRRGAEDLIRQGRVIVNGEVVTRLGMNVDREADDIRFDGQPLPVPPAPRVLMLNKPVGYVSTSRVSREIGKSVLELVPSDRRYFTVGRLDRDSSGLLLVTDDGDLAYLLAHPKHRTRKEYVVCTERRLTDNEIAQLRKGVPLEDGIGRALAVRRMNGNQVEIELGEGRKRQIRRMIDAVGAHVQTLHRIRVGSLRLGELAPGAWRELTADEIEQLRAHAVPADADPQNF